MEDPFRALSAEVETGSAKEARQNGKLSAEVVAAPVSRAAATC
jgi:hypothetical protein